MDSNRPVLIVEDEKMARLNLARNLRSKGYTIIEAADGVEAFEIMLNRHIGLVITDWMMPRMNGLELCKKLRRLQFDSYVYIIFITGREEKKDTVAALEAGADDYLIKPFNVEELHARIRTAERVLALEQELRGKNRVLNQIVTEQERALYTIRRLKELIPICMYCKKIRNDDDYWQQLEVYFHEQAEVDFSHGICPGCFTEHFGEKDKLGDEQPVPVEEK